MSSSNLCALMLLEVTPLFCALSSAPSIPPIPAIHIDRYFLELLESGRAAKRPKPCTSPNLERPNLNCLSRRGRSTFCFVLFRFVSSRTSLLPIQFGSTPRQIRLRASCSCSRLESAPNLSLFLSALEPFFLSSPELFWSFVAPNLALFRRPNLSLFRFDFFSPSSYFMSGRCHKGKGCMFLHDREAREKARLEAGEPAEGNPAKLSKAEQNAK